MTIEETFSNLSLEEANEPLTIFIDPGTRQHFNGYSYSRNRVAKITSSSPVPISYYRCSKYQSKGCCARLKVSHTHALPFQMTVTGDHTCVIQDTQTTNVINVEDEMKDMAAELALESVAKRPVVIWDEVMTKVQENHPGQSLHTMVKQQFISFVYKVRRDQYGPGWIDIIESAPTAIVSELDDRSFLQFNCNQFSGGEMHRFVCWAHPDLVHVARYPRNHLFIDATFRCVPRGFKQCLIFMIHDAASDVYLPVFYVLMSGKTEWCYWVAINYVLIATQLKLEPASVTCDFERALINAVQDQFPTASLVGCLFHWKQAIRRKMIEFRLPEVQVRQLMTPGVFDILTIIPINQIEKVGIPFVRSLIDETGDKLKWENFWKYFVNTWMVNYKPEWWNINQIANSDEDIQNRTSTIEL